MRSAGATVFAGVAAHAARRPQALALSGAGRSWRYAELADAAARLAGAFLERGAEKGSTFAIVSANHPATCIAWLAGARYGAIPSIVNSLLAPRELAGIFANLEPRFVIADAEHIAPVREALGMAAMAVPVLINTGSVAGLESLDDLTRSDPCRAPLPAPSDPFEITYTSGTTSSPKGVVLTHEAVLFRAGQQKRIFSMEESDTALAATPIFHQSGSRDCVLLAWHAGGHAHVLPRFSASTYWKDAIDCGATYTCMVETMALLLERQPVSPLDRSHGIRRVMGGGAPDLRERAEARFGFRFGAGYGMTECGFPVAIPIELSRERLRSFVEAGAGANFAGWPVGENEARIVDEAGSDVPEGGSGEILIRSHGLLREYWRNPGATASALKNGWLRTGDMGRRGAEGSIYFLDRIRDVIRRGGENIASKEVEDVLQAHPAIARAVVYPVPDPLFMQEVKAIVIAKPGASIDAQAVWGWCEEHLAKYKVPRYIEFRDSVPESGSGRAQKQLLREEPISGMGRTADRRSTDPGSTRPRR